MANLYCVFLIIVFTENYIIQLQRLELQHSSSPINISISKPEIDDAAALKYDDIPNINGRLKKYHFLYWC